MRTCARVWARICAHLAIHAQRMHMDHQHRIPMLTRAHAWASGDFAHCGVIVINTQSRGQAEPAAICINDIRAAVLARCLLYPALPTNSNPFSAQHALNTCRSAPTKVTAAPSSCGMQSDLGGTQRGEVRVPALLEAVPRQVLETLEQPPHLPSQWN